MGCIGTVSSWIIFRRTNIEMAAIICAAGHRLAFCAPYYPVDGPIEYAFNTIQGILRIDMDQIVDEATLIHDLFGSIASIVIQTIFH